MVMSINVCKYMYTNTNFTSCVSNCKNSASSNACIRNSNGGDVIVNELVML